MAGGDGPLLDDERRALLGVSARSAGTAAGVAAIVAARLSIRVRRWRSLLPLATPLALSLSLSLSALTSPAATAATSALIDDEDELAFLACLHRLLRDHDCVRDRRQAQADARKLSRP